MSLVHNERTKLTANALNTAATSSFTIGVLAPLAAAFYNIGAAPVPVRSIVAGIILWLFAALCFHYGARRLLGEFRS
jgi:hypothetical protein